MAASGRRFTQMKRLSLRDETHEWGLEDIRDEESTITHGEVGRTIPREKCLGWTGCVHFEEQVDKLNFMGSSSLRVKGGKFPNLGQFICF